MFKKITKYVCIVALLVIFITTAAYSYWRVDFTASSNSNLGVGEDDIAENYSFYENSNKFNAKNYTIYVFPSTIYLQSYLDYLNGKSSLKPEEIYGYIMPLEKEDGNLDYATDGSVQYVCSNETGDDKYLSSWVADGGTYAETYLSTRKTSRDNYYESVYESSNWLNATGADSYAYGDPEFDKTAVSYENYTSYEEQHNYRNLHRYDRFGYWPKVRKDEGRYLPLKIEADADFSSNYYEEVVKRPLADMGDPHDWYCYSFTLWSYVSIRKDAEGNRVGYKAPYYASNDFIKNLTSENQSYYSIGSSVNPVLSAFCPTTVSQYFDLMGDFSSYADEEGIIRLFPKFSNGKTYSENSQTTDKTGNTTLPCGFLNGGSDAIRMTPTYKSHSTFDQHDFYFSYLSILESYNNVSNVGVATLPNVAIDNYSSLIFQIESTVGFANWQGNWQNIFTLDEKIISSTVNTYGEGFYNIYIFVGNIGQSGQSSSSNTFRNLISSLKTADYKNSIFSSLVGKNFTEPLSTNISSNKSVAFAIEKVRDTRILMDISRDSIEEEQLQAKYNSTNQYFRYLSDDVYAITSGLNKVENISNLDPINSRYQYCYILNGVDFTNASTPNFQIRFQKRYRTDLHFSGTGGTKGENGDFAPNVDLIYKPTIENDEGKFSKEQRFVSAFDYYFDAQVKSINSATNEEQIIFNLKDEEYRGIYNLIIIYIPNEYYSATMDGKTKIYYDKAGLPTNYITHSAGFYMFAYRQTNVFMKIMANNPTKHYAYPSTDEKQKNNGFLIHDNEVTNNMLLFQKEYALGVAVKGTDKNEEVSYSSIEYQEYKKPSIGDILASCVNQFLLDWMKKDPLAPKTIEKVIIRDHVTGMIVASFKKVTPTTEELNEHQSDNFYFIENGEYYQLYFEEFHIRKNYVFYITYLS